MAHHQTASGAAEPTIGDERNSLAEAFAEFAQAQAKDPVFARLMRR